MNNPNYYGILPANVRYSTELKPMEKILYVEITALANKNGYCNATNSYFAELYGVHKDTAGKWINHLEKLGFIKSKIIYKDGTKQVLQRQLFICDTPIGNQSNTYRSNDGEPTAKKCDTPIGEKCEDNNTREEYYKKNNIKKNIKKENPLLKDFKDEDKKIAKEFIEYRKQIKHPVKTALAIKAHLRELQKCIDLGLGTCESLTQTMQEREWRTIKAEYLVKNKQPQQSTEDTQESFWGEFDNKQDFWDGMVPAEEFNPALAYEGAKNE